MDRQLAEEKVLRLLCRGQQKRQCRPRVELSEASRGPCGDIPRLCVPERHYLLLVRSLSWRQGDGGPRLMLEDARQAFHDAILFHFTEGADRLGTRLGIEAARLGELNEVRRSIRRVDQRSE